MGGNKLFLAHNFIFLLLFHLSVGVIYRDESLIGSGECGTLYTEPGAKGVAFPLGDQDQSVHLAEDQKATDSGWNVTRSVKVENGCKMRLCNDTYFDGNCTSFDSGVHSVDQTSAQWIASAACTCPKQCKCSDVHIKMSSCGRAYLDGGCRTCHSIYTDLDTNSSSVQSTSFPTDFRESVQAIVLRKGCKMTIYSDEDFDGDSTLIEQRITENFKGYIGSYECECNDALYEPRAKPPRPASYPELVDIPSDTNQVIKMLETEKYKNHPGLNAALRSYRNGRSSKNAYILLVGSTGAGKSSAINLLFDNQNITRVGDGKSTTSSIHEFRIPVPIDELGVANSELRVIDTPGMGDTRGLEQDAKYLATLENYLSTHEELKYRLPNVVLIFHKFHDNRFEGEGAHFVQMIRGLDYFRERITDQKYSNVIFVMSHFMSVTRATRRKPDARIKHFQQVIQDYSLYPRPTHLVVAENKAKDQDLPMVNGYFKLPNFDYYPRNLFEKMELVTEKCGDPIGQGVFRTAFRDSENFNVSRFDYHLMSSETTQAQKFLGLLTNANLNVNNTEVSRHLKQVWDSRMDTELKKRYPFSLAYLQKSLNLRHINNLEDVPRTTPEILELLTALKHDPATRGLLEKGLNIQPPVFTQNTLAGYGYHVFQDKPLTVSPFQLGELQHSDIGFRIPSSLTCNLEPGTKEHFQVFDDKGKYMQYRLQSLGIEGKIPVENFTNAVQPGCNIKSLSFRPNGCSVSATKDFHIFELVLNDRLKLTRDFENAVRRLAPVNTSDHASVVMWKEFFSTYGTHVVKSAYGGGSIQVHLESNQPFSAKFGEAIFNLVKFAEDLTYNLEYAKLNQTEETETGNATSPVKPNNLSQDTQQSTTFIGGDPNYHTTDLGKMPLTEASTLLSKWKKSLRLSPAMLTTQLRLQPISLIAKPLGQNYTEEIDKAARLLFDSELTWKPPPKKRDSGPADGRDQTPVLQEMMKFMQQQNERMHNLTLEMKKTEQENEKRRLELEKERLEWQRKQAEAEEKFRKEMLAANHKSEKERQEWQAKMMKQKQDHDAKMAAQLQGFQERLADQRKRDQEAADRRQKEIVEAMNKKSGGGGCLKTGTAILMADRTEKNVEILKVGDFVMDKDMRPSKVMGVATEFLLGHRFYGFEENGPFFFTSNHLFVGPGRENVGGYSKLQFYAASPEVLYEDNPLMEQLNVQRMLDFGNVSLFHLKNGKTELGTFRLENVYREGMEYPEDTLMYDIQVDSPTGTYFANGYVCRHEVPPLEYWPNTLSVLFRLLESPAFSDILENVPYNVDNLKKVHRIVDQMKIDLEYTLESRKWEQADETVHVEMMTLDSGDLEQAVSQLYRHSISSATILRLYSRLGPVIAHWMDSDNQLAAARDGAMLQDYLVKWTSAQLEQRLSILLS